MMCLRGMYFLNMCVSAFLMSGNIRTMVLFVSINIVQCLQVVPKDKEFMDSNS